MWLRGEERRKLRLRRSTAAVTAASSGSAMRFWVGRNRHATPCRPLRRHGTAGAGRQRPSGQLAGASRSDRGASRAGTKRRVPALLRGAHAGRSSRGVRCRPWHHRRHPQPSRRPRRQRLPTFRRSTFSLRTLATQAIEASRRDPADERRAVPVPGSGLVLPAEPGRSDGDIDVPSANRPRAAEDAVERLRLGRLSTSLGAVSGS